MEKINLSDLNLLSVAVRTLLAVLIGAFIGRERSVHGRAAGMRTHILVCLGAALTSMTSVYVSTVLGIEGDVFRISAQVISGIGFLGAGMIILKNNNMITGLTTAAGVWTTGAIGVAVGYGFYYGAVIVTVLFMASLVFFAKLEKQKKSTEVIYIEIDDIHKVNAVIDEIKNTYDIEFIFQAIPPKSSNPGCMGINLVTDRVEDFDFEKLCSIEHIAYALEDQ